MTANIHPVRLQPNRRKLLEVVLFLIGEGERIGKPLTQYDIVKSIFLADVAHLNKYGRPVTFDNYSALEFGPVPTEAYDMLKPSYPWGQHFNTAGPPWVREPVGRTAFHYVHPHRPAALRVLSESDTRALTEALQHVRELGFGGIRDETHSHPAYVAAWDKRGTAKAARMDYAALFEQADPETLEDLAFASTHAG